MPRSRTFAPVASAARRFWSPDVRGEAGSGRQVRFVRILLKKSAIEAF